MWVEWYRINWFIFDEKKTAKIKNQKKSKNVEGISKVENRNRQPANNNINKYEIWFSFQKEFNAYSTKLHLTTIYYHFFICVAIIKRTNIRTLYSKCHCISMMNTIRTIRNLKTSKSSAHLNLARNFCIHRKLLIIQNNWKCIHICKWINTYHKYISCAACVSFERWNHTPHTSTYIGYFQCFSS